MSSFVAEASVWIDAPPEVVFDKLADFPGWAEWMAPTFRPGRRVRHGEGGRERGPLRVGDRIQVYLAHLPLPTPIDVYVVDRPREITWGGGSKALTARHRFLFEVEGSGTRVRSVETWEGLADRIARPLLLPIAERMARAQLGALKRAV